MHRVDSERFLGDLEGSTGLKAIHQKHPEVFVPSGSTYDVLHIVNCP